MKILILGGSKFMGLDLLEKLINKKENNNLNIEIYIINRGKIYWNGLFYDIIKGKEFVKHFKANRKDKTEFITILEIIKNIDNTPFDYIVDFSCFSRKDLFILDILNFYNYIFISTDSTYNASPISLTRNDDFFFNNEYTKVKSIIEEDAIISNDKELNKKLKKRDDYGYKKLKCEIEIKRKFNEEGWKDKGINFLILRLPDVIGSYDESFRTWYYIEWMKFLDIKPIELEKIDLVRKLSFVLKEDVIDLILTVIFDQININRAEYLNQEYNLACDEIATLYEILQFLSEKLKIELKYEIKDLATTYYPSVTFGPIDNYKAKKYLNFNPTKLYESFDREIEFFLYVDSLKYEKFLEGYREIIKDLPKKIASKINSKLYK